MKKLHKDEFVRMLTLMGKNKWRYIIGLIGGCFCPAFFRVISAFVNRNMINAATTGETRLLIQALYMAMAALIFACIVDPIFRYIFNKSIKETMRDIRGMVFAHVEKLPMDYFEKNHSGDTISRLTNDINVMENAYGGQMFALIISSFMGISSAVTMFSLDYKLAILMIILGLISMKINVTYASPIRKISDEVQKRKGMSTKYLGDILAGYRVIKMLSLTSIMDRYVDENAAMKDKAMERVKKNCEVLIINHIMSTISFVGVLTIGAFMVDKQISDFGTITAIISLHGGVTFMFTQFGNFFTQLQESLSGAARVFEILEVPGEPEKSDIKGVDNDKENMIAINDVCFNYDEEKVILDQLSLQVKKGQVAALVGASGGGKSTIIKLLLGFYPIHSGEVFIDGSAMGDYTIEHLRNLMAYVPQDAYLFEGTIEENILYARPKASEEDIMNAAKMANAHDFIMQMQEGYKTKVGERGLKLSGGQRQRIAIARAILKDAPILLLDEATSALDSESEMLVQQALSVLMKGRTTLVIAHRLSTIENADIIYVIEQGKVKEQGSHEELLSFQGSYYNLQKLQFKLEEENIAS
jgi:ABC-type multidrug transport system fused ATPase/permease subunit